MSANQLIGLAFREMCRTSGNPATAEEMYNAWMPEHEAAEWLRAIADGKVYLGVAERAFGRNPALFSI